MHMQLNLNTGYKQYADYADVSARLAQKDQTYYILYY